MQHGVGAAGSLHVLSPFRRAHGAGPHCRDSGMRLGVLNSDTTILDLLGVPCYPVTPRLQQSPSGVLACHTHTCSLLIINACASGPCEHGLASWLPHIQTSVLLDFLGMKQMTQVRGPLPPT